jgi:hypothetical protein
MANSQLKILIADLVPATKPYHSLQQEKLPFQSYLNKFVCFAELSNLSGDRRKGEQEEKKHKGDEE